MPDNTSVTNVFYPTSDLELNSGSRAYATGSRRDAQGRLTGMTNWTTFPSAGARVTSWTNDAYRGFPINKAYPDGKGPSYTFTAAGRLKTATWARGVVTTNSLNTAGDVSGVTFSDGTPSLTIVFDRRGRPATNIQGSVTCTLVFNDPGQLLSESYSGGALNGISLTNGYDASLRRFKQVLLLNGSVLTTATNGFDAASRLQAVSDGTNSATYAYLANSPLISSLTFKQNGTTRLTTTKGFDNLNRLTGLSNAPSGGATLSFNYTYNSANQRTAVTNQDSSRWAFQNDFLGQVTSGKKYWSDGTIVAGQQFEYGFDDIGNRTYANSGGDAAGASLRTQNYTVNNLNQYTQRTVPGYLDVLGAATNTANVAVNNTLAYRKSDYYRQELTIANGSAAVWQSVTNVALLTQGTNGETMSATTGSVFLAQSPESFGFDADGNQTNDGRWTFSWNAQNQLTNIVSLASSPTASKRKLDFTYDYLGRRTQKIVSTNNGSSYVGQYTNKFVYDGWNLIAILDAQSSLLYSFRWGTDLSGTMQGAGGVGGLISMTVHSGALAGVYFYGSDANGNVDALISAADGTIGAQYEYGPFHELIRATGPLTSLNPFRESTKFQDDETGFIYYGYRYYNPSTGRWLSPEPLGESASRNRFGFVDNDGLNFFDLDGLEKGAELLMHHNSSAFGDIPINPVNGLQLLVGIPFSLLSGDIFFNDFQKIPNGQCNVLIFVNGINNTRTDAKNILADLLTTPRYRNVTFGIAAGNRTSRLGDYLQIVGDEFGTIQSASFQLARQINETYDAFKRNGCCCGSIQVFAHSQGAKVFQHAQSLIKPAAKKLISYTGIGGETRITSHDFAVAPQNYRHPYDPVPWLQFLNPINWPSQPFIPAETRDLGGHGYNTYRDWVHALDQNAPCVPVPER